MRDIELIDGHVIPYTIAAIKMLRAITSVTLIDTIHRLISSDFWERPIHSIYCNKIIIFHNIDSVSQGHPFERIRRFHLTSFSEGRGYEFLRNNWYHSSLRYWLQIEWLQGWTAGWMSNEYIGKKSHIWIWQINFSPFYCIIGKAIRCKK